MTEHLSKTPYTIRPYAPKDRERLREICLATATPRVYENRALREWILLMYNDYYTALEGAHCFVGVDDQDRPLGYVICAPSYRRYRLRFLPFLPAIARRSKAAAKRWLFHSGRAPLQRNTPPISTLLFSPRPRGRGWEKP